MRLRNLGGIIIIDFIDMEDEEHQRQVLRTLEKQLERDHAKTNIIGITELGLVQMTRKRTRESLEQVLCEPCSSCQGRGKLKTPETICYEIFREILREARAYQAEGYRVLANQKVVDRLLSSLTLGASADRRPQVGVQEKGVSALESLLFAKYQMYRNVYWHHAVRSATAMYKRVVSDALDAGAAEGDEGAATEAATIRTKSPMACKVSLKMLVESPYQLHFVDEMRMEYGIMVRMIRHPDFKEGVRALLIDKDNNPQWDPPTPEEVDEEMLDVLFEPLPPHEQWTPFPETGE